MKPKLPLLLAIILVLASCGLLGTGIARQEYWNYSFNDGGLSFASLEGVCTWMSTNVAYDTDVEQWGYSEYWASPEQTFSSRKGDCDDKSILFMYLARAASLAPDPLFVAVLEPGNLGHAMVRIGGTYYDPTWGTWGAWSEITNPVLYTLNYGEAMYIATHDHDAVRSMARGTPLDSPWYNGGQNQARSHDVGAASSPATLKNHAAPRRVRSAWPKDLVDQRRGAPGR